jgi:hypothetical protein
MKARDTMKEYVRKMTEDIDSDETYSDNGIRESVLDLAPLDLDPTENESAFSLSPDVRRVHDDAEDFEALIDMV